MMVEEFQA
jgi:hypothetical protein